MEKKIKILVTGHDQKFWYPLQRILEATGKYQFKEDMWTGHAQHDVSKSEELLKWADIIICEWALGNAVYYSKKKLSHQKIIIRLHAQEKNTKYPKHINYANVSAIIFVGQHILDECIRKFSIPKNIVYFIPNFIDVKIFDHKKFSDSEFTIGIIGTAPKIKRMDLAYATLQYLQKIDQRYILRIKGKNPASYSWLIKRDEEKNYYEKIYTKINSSNLKYKIIFDPFDHNVSTWLRYIGFILSPSDRESFHVAPAEGMASSAIPIIWKREGSSDIFPTVVKTDSPKLAAEQIDFYRRTKAGDRYKKISQNFILSTFDSKVTAAWEKLLNLEETNSQHEREDKSKQKLLIFFSIGNWETFHRREMIEALARHLNNEYNFLIIEPGTHYKTIVDTNIAPAIELDPMLELKPIKVSDNIYRIRIMNSGLPIKRNISDILRKNFERDQIIYKATKYMFGHDTEIVYWIFKHDQLPWVQKGSKVVYEVYDDYALDFESGRILEKIRDEEREVLPLVDHVFFTSQPLAYRKSSYAKSWSIVGNGVNYDIFAKYREQKNLISEKRTSVGYLGNLSNFFNWELMCKIVVKMPQIDFVFYGQIELENMGKRKDIAEELMSCPNTLFTGRVTREEGAVGINLVDVLIIPFVINDAMHAVNPLKLWEYFATGKPVVSTPMDAISVKEPLLKVASTVDEWVNKINVSLLEDDISIKKDRIALAKENSWDTLTIEHTKIVDNL